MADMQIPAKPIPRRWHVLMLTLLALAMSLPGLAGLQVIDRDEARFAQASVQMAESRDYVNIRYQHEARNKKPIGAYWAQTAAIKAFGKTGKRDIWVQRLPSVLAGLLAVLASYWAGLTMLGRRGAFLAAGFLAVSLLFVFESHIAKTDAMLCASGAFVFCALAHLRAGSARRFYALMFWAAMGAALLIKGPVIPGITLLTLITLAIWERGDNGWIKRLFYWPGPLLMLAIVLPWAVMIYFETNGQFYKDALLGDFGGKLVGAAENHSGPPGFYLASLPFGLWPASLFLLPGLAFAIRAVRKARTLSNPVTSAMRLCLAWALPYWAVIEILPTKLVNYLLPAYPSFVMMAAGAALTLMIVKEFPWTRRIGAVLFSIISIAIILAILLAESRWGPAAMWPYIMAGLGILAAFFTSFSLWTARGRWAIGGVVLSALLISPASYQFILPSLTGLQISGRVADSLSSRSLTLPRNGGALVLAPTYTEPSLVYALGQEIQLGDRANPDQPLTPGTIIINDLLQVESEPFAKALKAAGNCTEILETIEGINMSRMDPVTLEVSRVTICAPEPEAPSPPAESMPG